MGEVGSGKSGNANTDIERLRYLRQNYLPLSSINHT